MAKWLSKPAVLWALYEAPDVPARLVSTLVAVAVHADENGRGAYPSAATVASITRKSETQAKRDMAELEKLGLLQPGDGRIVMDIRADRRPNVYDVTMPRGVTQDTPSGSQRGASGRTPLKGSRGASGYTTGCIPLQDGVRPDAPEEVLKTSGNARANGAGAPSRSLTPHPPWCGDCDEITRQLEDDEGNPYRCPACHRLGAAFAPANGRHASERRP